MFFSHSYFKNEFLKYDNIIHRFQYKMLIFVFIQIKKNFLIKNDRRCTKMIFKKNSNTIAKLVAIIKLLFKTFFHISWKIYLRIMFILEEKNRFFSKKSFISLT